VVAVEFELVDLILLGRDVADVEEQVGGRARVADRGQHPVEGVERVSVGWAAPVHEKELRIFDLTTVDLQPIDVQFACKAVEVETRCGRVQFERILTLR